MIEFNGTYSATLDDKGRVVLPATLKKEMGNLANERLIIQKNMYKACIDVFPERFWEDRVKAFKNTLDPFDEDDDAFLQIFYENFTKVEMAPNGRISIPSEFQDYTGIKKNIRIIGMGDLIRLWDFDEYQKSGSMDRKTFVEKFKEKRKTTKNNP